MAAENAASTQRPLPRHPRPPRKLPAGGRSDLGKNVQVPALDAPTRAGGGIALLMTYRAGMTISLPEQSPQQRRTARIAGWLMASTFVTAILAAIVLYDPVLNDTDYILGGGDDTRVTLGALLEIFLMIGNVGTAVVMFPILRRYSETLWLSYVASRTIEATIIGVGAIGLLFVVTLRDDVAASSARAETRWTSRGRPWSRSTTGRSCSGRILVGIAASCSAG